jgi:hypothetical protein
VIDRIVRTGLDGAEIAVKVHVDGRALCRVRRLNANSAQSIAARHRRELNPRRKPVLHLDSVITETRVHEWVSGRNPCRVGSGSGLLLGCLRGIAGALPSGARVPTSLAFPVARLG